jgi:hypothetical protein
MIAETGMMISSRGSPICGFQVCRRYQAKSRTFESRNAIAMALANYAA